MKLAKAQASIYDIQKQLNSIIIQLKDYISSLPDNPNIQRKNNKCFIMNSKHLQNNWSVLYYDYRQQYEEIIKIISGGQPQYVVGKLKNIIREQQYEKIRFHPDVIKNLKTILLRG